MIKTITAGNAGTPHANKWKKLERFIISSWTHFLPADKYLKEKKVIFRLIVFETKGLHPKKSLIKFVVVKNWMQTLFKSLTWLPSECKNKPPNWSGHRKVVVGKKTQYTNNIVQAGMNQKLPSRWKFLKQLIWVKI